MEIQIVNESDNPCPKCQAYWGHPNPDLDFPNRPKVQDENGVDWWKCYNPSCTISYFTNTGETE